MQYEFLGPYRIDGVLGRGGMGTVYRGVHASQGEVVAIKVISPQIADQQRFRRRFAAEIETLRRLKHPNIVRLLGYGEERGHLFYAMELVEGPTLHQHLRDVGRLGWRQVVQMGQLIASALHHAHAIGVIHRDLKPANILLTPGGAPKLTDFGVAKLFGGTDMTATGAILGTADYMPPEQAEGKPVTVRSDLYSLGAVMYACLCGRPPFTGKTLVEVLYAVRHHPAPPVGQWVAGVPESLQGLIDQLLEKSQSKRPPTALVVQNRLLEVLQGSSISDAPLLAGGGEPTFESQQLESIDLGALGLRAADSALTGESELTGDSSPTSAAEAAAASGRVGSAAESFDLSDDEPSRFEAADGVGSGEPAGSTYRHFEASEDVDAGESSMMLRRAETQLATPSQLEPTPEVRPLGGPPSDRLLADATAASKSSHFTRVDEFSVDDSRDQRQTGARIDYTQMLSIGLLAGLLLVLLWGSYLWLQPPTADQLWSEIDRAADSQQEDRLLGISSSVDRFLMRYADDPRAEQVKLVAEEIELLKAMRSIRRRSTGGGGGSAGVDPVERIFADAIQQRESDPSAAARRLAALLDLLHPDLPLSDQQQRLRRLVERELRELLKQSAEPATNRSRQRLADQLRQAEKHLSGPALERYHRALRELFADQPWAVELLRQAAEGDGPASAEVDRETGRGAEREESAPR
jgi:eukaryotic-like serine/threonine-protein kinase